MTFLLTLNASTIRPTPLVEKLQIAASAGYAGIELWHDEIEEYSRQGNSLSDLRKRIDDLGLVVPSTINLKGWLEAESFADPAWEHCRIRLEQASALGARYIVAGPPRQQVDWNLAAANFRHLTALADGFGTAPSMEFLGFVTRFCTIESALRVVTDSGVPNGTLVLDPFHIFLGGGSFESVRSLTPQLISVCHFNDAPETANSDADRVLPGEGRLPLVSMLRHLIDMGYVGPLSLELFSEKLWREDPLEVAERGLEKMRRLIGQAQSSHS